MKGKEKDTGDILSERPYRSFVFSVAIDNITVAEFSEVTGLNGEVEVEERREGGNNMFMEKFPKMTKYGNLVLKRGVTHSLDLYKWYDDVTKRIFKKHNVTVTLEETAPNGKKIKSWSIQNALPVKWSSSDLNAQGNNILVESIELVHEGITVS